MISLVGPNLGRGSPFHDIFGWAQLLWDSPATILSVGPDCSIGHPAMILLVGPNCSMGYACHDILGWAEPR